jgi:hypothetical protein
VAKIVICDKCKVDDGKITETTRYLSVRRHPDMRMDLCSACITKFHAKVGNRLTAEYVQEVYRLHGYKIDLDTARAMSLRMI